MTRVPRIRLAKLQVSVFASAAILLSLLAHPASAAQGFFLGDSIADDTAKTVGMPGAARTGEHLRRGAVIPQFTRLPKGSVALMSLGLNDAEDSYKGLIGDIERVITAAEATGEKFVWIGPPCVRKSWDNHNEQLDAYLSTRLAATRIQYVSLRDPKICGGGIRSGDGEHFTEAGYRYVWEKVKRDSAFAALVEPTAAPSEAAPSKIDISDVPKPQRVHRQKKRSQHQASDRQPRWARAD
jgi:hypothetical protein